MTFYLDRKYVKKIFAHRAAYLSRPNPLSIRYRTRATVLPTVSKKASSPRHARSSLQNRFHFSEGRSYVLALRPHSLWMRGHVANLRESINPEMVKISSPSNRKESSKAITRVQERIATSTLAEQRRKWTGWRRRLCRNPLEKTAFFSPSKEKWREANFKKEWRGAVFQKWREAGMRRATSLIGALA